MTRSAPGDSHNCVARGTELASELLTHEENNGLAWADRIRDALENL